MGYRDVMGELYRRYYDCAEFSDVTSSHWKRYGSLTKVVKKDEQYILSGVGFGHFVPINSLRSLKYFLPSRMALRLMSRFHVDGEIKSFGLQAAKRAQRQIDFDCVKQILSVDLLRKKKVFNKDGIIMVIGDGYGYTTALLRMMLPEATIICINLGRTLFFDAYYLEKVLPNEKCRLIKDHTLNSVQKGSMIFWEAENYQALVSLPVDLFINIASMQEMDMEVVRNYFTVMRSGAGKRYFYCCNRVEKILPDGAVIRFDEYPWERKDKIIFDELCPWHQRFPVLEPPFWKAFDGSTQHRLVKLCE